MDLVTMVIPVLLVIMVILALLVIMVILALLGIMVILVHLAIMVILVHLVIMEMKILPQIIRAVMNVPLEENLDQMLKNFKIKLIGF